MPLAAELPKEMQSLQFRPLFIFRINVAKPSVIGQTPSVNRRVGEITGGVFEVERLRGKILSGAPRRLEGARRPLRHGNRRRTPDRHDLQGHPARAAGGARPHGQGRERQSVRLLFPGGAVLRDGLGKIRVAEQRGVRATGHRLASGPIYQVFEAL